MCIFITHTILIYIYNIDTILIKYCLPCEQKWPYMDILQLLFPPKTLSYWSKHPVIINVLLKAHEVHIVGLMSLGVWLSCLIKHKAQPSIYHSNKDTHTLSAINQ